MMPTQTHTESHLNRRKYVADEDVQQSDANHVSFLPMPTLQIQHILSIPIRFVPATRSTYEDEASMNPTKANDTTTFEGSETSDLASEHGENVRFPLA